MRDAQIYSPLEKVEDPPTEGVAVCHPRMILSGSLSNCNRFPLKTRGNDRLYIYLSNTATACTGGG